jgi:hypothetical protein
MRNWGVQATQKIINYLEKLDAEPEPEPEEEEESALDFSFDVSFFFLALFSAVVDSTRYPVV